MSNSSDGSLSYLWVAEPERKMAITRAILADLPAWFGIPESTAAYVAGVAGLPFLAALATPDDSGLVEPALARGFMALKDHGPHASEIYVTGVLRDWHRRGIGRHLVDACASRLRADGKRYLTVKTLAASRSNAEYDRTRRFYQALGFVELEVIPELWGSDNPCLLLLKNLSEAPCTS